METSCSTTSVTRTSGGGAVAGLALARSQPLPATTASTASVAARKARYRKLRVGRVVHLATADATSRPCTWLPVATCIGLLLVRLLTKLVAQAPCLACAFKRRAV